MANVATAIDYVLGFEDASLSGKVTKDAGGRTRFGIAEAYHPYMAMIGFYDAMTKDQALGAAQVVYVRDYALPMKISLMDDQGIANKLLSLGVNIGLYRVSEWLQKTLDQVQDGQIGGGTLQALKKADPKTVMQSLKNQACSYYQELVKQYPKDEIYLKGWLARANA